MLWYSGTVISKIIEESHTPLASSMSIPGVGAHTAESAEEIQQEIQARKNEQVNSLDINIDIVSFSTSWC